MIHFACPTCKKEYDVPDAAAGRKTKCRTCGQGLRVPVAVSSSPPPPPLPPHQADDSASVALGSLTPDLHAKARHNSFQAFAQLVECQSHLKVYGTRLTEVARDGLEFIEAALQINPDSSEYWNTKGLLLTNGLGEHQKALRCLRRALELEPDSIVIKQNIREVENALKGGGFGVVYVVLLVGFLLFLPCLLPFLLKGCSQSASRQQSEPTVPPDAVAVNAKDLLAELKREKEAWRKYHGKTLCVTGVVSHCEELDHVRMAMALNEKTYEPRVYLAERYDGDWRDGLPAWKDPPHVYCYLKKRSINLPGLFPAGIKGTTITVCGEEGNTSVYGDVGTMLTLKECFIVTPRK